MKRASITPAKTHKPGKRKLFLIALILLVVISIISSLVWNKIVVQPDLIGIISLQERQILGELVLTVASSPDDFPSVYNSFWNILKKYDAVSESQLTYLKNEMRELFYLPKLFYEDARKAIKNKSPFMSGEREKLEKHYLEKGFLTKQQTLNDEETMRLIAQRKPIQAAHGVEIFIDEKRIIEMLQEWDEKELENIVKKLFTPGL